MKKIRYSFIFILSILFSPVAFPQDFEGRISYRINYGDLPEEMKAYESMLPREMNYLVKGDKSKMTQPSAMGGETIVIADQGSNKTTVLINSMGYKVAVSSDMGEKEGKAPDIQYVDGSKNIAGYDCKKAILTDENGIKTTLWYTEEIPALDINLGLEGINGLPLEFESEQNGINAKIVANSVTEESVADSEFVIPEGYEEMNQEEFQEMMKSQAGGM